MFENKYQNSKIGINALNNAILRIRISTGGEFSESLLNRYKILHDFDDIEFKRQKKTSDGFSVSTDELTLKYIEKAKQFIISGADVPMSISYSGYNNGSYVGDGFTLKIVLSSDERIFGLGDESRVNIARRGTKAEMNMQNINSYGPIPFFMSTNGWGILVNNTFPHSYDIGSGEKDSIVINSKHGFIDIYIFIPKSHKLTDILSLYTDVSGKPLMLPKSAYGYTFVLNEQTDARQMLDDCLKFREKDIPCDIVGLEPQWMENNYDKSINKKWSTERFYIPQWLPENQSGPETFFYALREMGYKFSLWLCNDYDLLWEEERNVGKEIKDKGKYSYTNGTIFDEHLSCPEYQDNVTVRDVPWFKHLEKFVDNGASAFKLDGAFQCNEHPDRLWAGKYLDREVHNVYPVIYAKQMMQGFSNYTKGRRALIYTPCIYAGSQQYCASWAGDTGGGFDTVIAMLNYGLSGHTNVTCDMDVTTRESIHYGFLCPWTQQLGWRAWNQPWYLRPELEKMIRYYSKLRSSLFPYIYSMAHKSSETGLPIARALSLVYPENAEYDNIKNEYMFGDSMLVGVFDMNIVLPTGKWIDFFTKKVYTGGKKIKYNIPNGFGGALFVKAGSIIPRMKALNYLDEKSPEYYDVEVYPGSNCENYIVEDDGMTYDYLLGKEAKTKISITENSDEGFELTIYKRIGRYTGRPIKDNKFYITSSEPKIAGMPKAVPLNIYIETNKMIEVKFKGKNIEIKKADGGYVFNIESETREKSDLVYTVKYKR